MPRHRRFTHKPTSFAYPVSCAGRYKWKPDCKRPSFASQKVAFCTLKGNLLHAKRRQIGMALRTLLLIKPNRGGNVMDFSVYLHQSHLGVNVFNTYYY